MPMPAPTANSRAFPGSSRPGFGFAHDQHSHGGKPDERAEHRGEGARRQRARDLRPDQRTDDDARRHRGDDRPQHGALALMRAHRRHRREHHRRRRRRDRHVHDVRGRKLARVNRIVSSGTSVMPPPMPSSPARKPTSRPDGEQRRARCSVQSITDAVRELLDDLPLRRRDRRDRQAVARAQRRPCRSRPGVARSIGSVTSRVLLHELHVDVHPARRLARRLRVVIRALRVELRRVRISELRDLDDARDAGLGAARVIEERAIADAHVVAHEIARLVVAHAEPRRRLLRRRGRDRRSRTRPARISSASSAPRHSPLQCRQFRTRRAEPRASRPNRTPKLNRGNRARASARTAARVRRSTERAVRCMSEEANPTRDEGAGARSRCRKNPSH